MGVSGLFGRERVAVVVLDLHAKGRSSLGYCSSNASHTENTQDLVLGVMAETKCLATPFTLADSIERDSDASQGSQHEEDGNVSRCIVDSNGCARDLDSARSAGLDVDVVISSAIVCNVFDARGEQINQLFVKGPCHARRLIAAVYDEGVVEIARL